MAPRVALVPVEPWHLAAVAAAPRAADVAECWASNRQTVGEALEAGMRISVASWTGLVDDEPVCVFGVAPASLLTGVGIPWLLATDGLRRAQRPLVRLSRPVLEVMHAWFPQLVNFVDNRNERAMRLLRGCGFTLSDPFPMGEDGILFRRFERTSHV